jgi:hypothetical protein
VAKAAAAAVARSAQRILDGTANPDGVGLLLRGLEYQPSLREDFDPLVVDALIRLARLAGTVADALRECPDARARHSAAVLAARAHPIRAAFDD